MTQTLGSLTNFVTPKQSGMPGESSGNGHRSYWRMQGANSGSRGSSRSSIGSRSSSASRGCKVLTPASSFPTSSHKDNWNIDQTWNLGQNNEPVQVEGYSGLSKFAVDQVHPWPWFEVNRRPSLVCRLARFGRRQEDFLCLPCLRVNLTCYPSFQPITGCG